MASERPGLSCLIQQPALSPQGVYKVSAETGAVIETSLRPIAKIPGTPSSLHAFRTAADEPGLLVLDSEDGVIYKAWFTRSSLHDRNLR